MSLIEYNKILNEYFNHKELKPQQFDIIDTIINKQKDVCAILATGFGKSLCYQLPYLITNKTVIVISPLIALMADQGYEMNEKNIPVCIFNSETSKTDFVKYKKVLEKGKARLVYMTPEFFVKSEEFVKQLSNNLLMVCVDEAHAVSTWGLDFRVSYTKLNIIKEWLPETPILTLTATASVKVRKDIIKILELVEPIEIIGDFNRPNLYINVEPKDVDYINKMASIIQKFPDDYVIIYASTREETEKLALKLGAQNINCKAYHAGMSTEERTEIQTKFLEGDYKCMIATIAFGMGINISNVRAVIHNNCPKNMESYYQEIGRAGRDGEPSECHLFYSDNDFRINRYFLKSMTNLEHKEYQEEQIRTFEHYIYSKECRKKVLLSAFGQKLDACNFCDNCKRNLNKNQVKQEYENYVKAFYIIMKAIKLVDGKFGITSIINLLVGKKAKDFMMKQPFFNTGTEYKADWWKAFAKQLIHNNYLIEKQRTGAFGSTVSLTIKGKQAFNKLNKYEMVEDINENVESLLFEKIEEIQKKKKVKK